MGEQRTHWDRIYEGKAADQVSWYTPHLARSLAFIEAAGLAPDAAILDVGGGASTLVDDLLARRFSDITVLDLSAAAVRKARERLGERAASVRWVVGDVTEVELPEASVDFWHDRAVFHFLREEEARRRYVASVRRAVKPGGHVLVATFGPDGPERCSGLDVLRYASPLTEISPPLLMEISPLGGLASGGLRLLHPGGKPRGEEVFGRPNIQGAEATNRQG